MNIFAVHCYLLPWVTDGPATACDVADKDFRIPRFYIWLLLNRIRVRIPYCSWNKIEKDENKSTW